MKIALLDMGYISENQSDSFELGIGSLIISNVLKKNNCKVYLYSKEKQSESISVRKFVDWIQEIKPDIIAFSTRCDNYSLAIRVSREIKKVYKSCLIIFGGPQATHTDISTIKNFSEVDIIVRGEGEETISDLINALSSKRSIDSVKGITYKKQDKVIRNEDRDLLSDFQVRPDYNIMSNDYITLFKKNMKGFRIEVGRGCPYSCTFCSTCNMWRRRYRIKDVKLLYNEMLLLEKNFNIKHFLFEHDSLTADNIQFSKFLRELNEINEKKFTWECSSRIDTLISDNIRKMKLAGCRGIYLGIESGSNRMQKILNKNLNLDKVQKKLDLLYENGINFTASFVCGHPFENIDDINETIKLAIICSLYPNCTTVQLHKLSPVNGSVLFEEWKDNLIFDGLISDQAECRLMEEDLELIQEYKDVFSAFYSFPLEENIKDIIKNITGKGKDLINKYPRTLWYTMQLLKITPIELIMSLNCYSNMLDGIKEIFISHELEMPLTLMDILEFEYTSERLQDDELQVENVFSYESIYVNPNSFTMSLSVNPLEYKNIINGLLINNNRTELVVWKKDREKTIRFKKLDDVDQIILSLVKNNCIKKIKFLSNKINGMIKEGLLIKNHLREEV